MIRQINGVAIALFALTGCTPTLMGGNEAGGIIDRKYSATPRKAFELAQTQCAKYGKNAVVTGQNFLDNSLRYECVAK